MYFLSVINQYGYLNRHHHLNPPDTAFIHPTVKKNQQNTSLQFSLKLIAICKASLSFHHLVQIQFGFSLHTMASNTVDSAPAPAQRPPTEPHANPRRDQRRNRGDPRRGLVQGQQELQGAPEQQDRPQQERRRGGQRRRGREANNGSDRRGQPASQVANNLNQPAPVLDPPPGLGGGGTFGGRLTKDATNEEGEVLTQGRDPSGEKEQAEAEVCFICASPVVYHSIAPCNHQTCHICALRLRALYKTRACAHCRVSLFKCLNPRQWLIKNLDGS